MKNTKIQSVGPWSGLPQTDERDVLLTGLNLLDGLVLMFEAENQMRLIFANQEAVQKFHSFGSGDVPNNLEAVLDILRSCNSARISDQFGDQVRNASEGGRSETKTEIQFFDQPYMTTCHAVQAGSGQHYKVCFLRDIAVRKELQAAQSDLIAVVSHELRAPLASIKGALELLHAGALGDLTEDVKRIISIAIRNSDQLMRVVNEILDEEKQRFNDSTLAVNDMVPVSVSALLYNAIEANQAFADQFGTVFDVDIVCPAAEVFGNPHKLMQVLSNLMSNAVKFSPKNSRITLQVTDQKEVWRISVKDQGPGISDKDRDQLFRRFSQLTQAPEGLAPGSGLGLSIAKEIVQRHKGELSFANLEGSGAEFFFDLRKWEEGSENL